MKFFFKYLMDLSAREVYLLNAAGLAGAGLGVLIFHHDLNGIFILCGAAGWLAAARHVR